MKKNESGENSYVRSLVKGEHFGEIALINSTQRTLSVLARTDTVKLLALNRESFIRILGNIERYLKKDYEGEFDKRQDKSSHTPMETEELKEEAGKALKPIAETMDEGP